tara:strand:- start:13182 stop:13757 length:576 start_codon:yes stop_codon:yes gene_type:complete
MSLLMAITQMDQGYLSIILGCMYSGKTSKLVSIYKHNKIANISTCVVNYIDDNRYDNVLMSTHDGRKIPCVKAKKIYDIFEKDKDLLENTKCFIINEGQFFEDLYDVVNLLVNQHKKIVYVGGLDGDFKMKKFGQILDLIPLSDKVEKLTAICSLCKKTASFTKRIIKNDEQILIGSSDMYIPVCRKCHLC